ncbi:MULTISPECIES: PqiC family protein [Bordetella]|uniref:ABC-type transport auxiliary lipoprotein component domain-containing protein n=2 Tax=Bordetella TaxID=517 RepID=A0A261VPM4_9BORD|nr:MULTISPECIES: PqiC family protein [Bordetella]MDM9559090.1 PqiC family protein [Bordetella petrii]OZI76068.1 hypothetical protein CAL24_12860 [Bordetella genomosp. 2]
MPTRRLPLLLSSLALGAALAGCGGSPPARYHTLQAPLDAAASTRHANYLIEVAPVSVPMQADQPQIMLRNDAGSLTPLYSDRWSAPLADEIGAALSDTLTRSLGTLDVRTIKPAEGAPVWRVQADVQRFDMIEGGPARIDATWRVRPLHLAGASTLACRSIVTVPAGAGAGVAPLVQAQQRAIALLGATMASAIQAGGREASPPSAEVQLAGCTK